VSLPTRLIELYTYAGDLVLDPFMGVGTTAVAAVRTGRHFVGYETDAGYVEQALQRVAAEDGSAAWVRVPAVPSPGHGDHRLDRALRDGRSAREVAEIVLGDAGFADVRSGVKLPGLGVELSFIAADRTGGRWMFHLSGAFASTRAGLRRTDALWKALGTAAVLHCSAADLPLVLLTTDAPTRQSAGGLALAAVTGPGRPVHDVVELLDPAGHARLQAHAGGGGDPRPRSLPSSSRF
jgi:hypothetical protein